MSEFAAVSELLKRAKLLHQGGHLAEAERLYVQILSADPQQFFAWYLLGVCRHGLGRLDAAAEALQNALRLNPQHADAQNYLGVVHAAAGRADEAIASFRAAVLLNPSLAEAQKNLAIACERAGRLDEAVAAYEGLVSLAPRSSDAHRGLGVVLRKQGRDEDALKAYRRAVELDPGRVEGYADLGLLLEKTGQASEAEMVYREALRRSLRSAELLSQLGALLGRSQATDEAIAFCREAVRLKPDHPAPRNNLGVLLEKRQQWTEAADCYRAAVERDPNLVAPYYNLGGALGKLGRFQEAESWCRRAIQVNPASAEAHHNLGFLLAETGRVAEALACYENALSSNPDFVETLYTLGGLLGRLGRLDEAEANCRRAIALQPSCAEAHSNLGFVLVEKGRIDDARSCYEEALRLQPGSSTIRSSYLFCLQYDPAVGPEELLDEHRRWVPMQAAAGHDVVRATGEWSDDRPLRVGYLSADLRRHPVASFLEPILANHDPRQVVAIGYADVPAPDATTARLRALAHDWRPISGLTDQAVVDLIAADRIDVLVDLAGHTARHRLGVFARKPAPVQVTYLGYPGTTGLSEIDFLLTDAVVDPPGEPPSSSEALARLPNGFCCYAPPPNAPSVAPLPALSNGHVTLGSLHKLSKLNERVVDLWAGLLLENASFHLLLFRTNLAGRRKDELFDAFVRRGVPPGRLDFRNRTASGNHLDVYASIDLSLDVFPWCGHTTACESLWMGVPIVTLATGRHATRMTASVLTMLGLPEFIAHSPSQYLAVVREWAGDLGRLQPLRAGLRERMQGSRLCDGPAFTRDLEQAYRRMARRGSAPNA